MTADPIPDYRVSFEQAENPIVSGHTRRVNWLFLVNAFELQTRMVRIRHP